jgi:N-methylhydantoinase A/acetophenone carboxylase
LVDQRPAYWSDAAEPVMTPRFSQALLKAGNRLSGPAIVEANYTTIVVDPGFQLEVDQYLNMIIVPE